jgi:Osmosensitive K+ channel His kinase sensor domain
MYHQILKEPRPSSSNRVLLYRDSKKDAPLSSTERFRDLNRKPQTGSLKIFVTRVPLPSLFDGMVSEGKRLLSIGVDAVVALDGERTKVEFPATHIIPAKEVRGNRCTFHEMDYDALLRRSPEVVIMDNLLHVNISVSGNEMRYHTVRDLLDNGINVVISAYSAFGDNLKTALEYVSQNFPDRFDRCSRLPDDDIFTLVFSQKEHFRLADICNSTGSISIQ